MRLSVLFLSLPFLRSICHSGRQWKNLSLYLPVSCILALVGYLDPPWVVSRAMKVRLEAERE
jgi:hypothetical protein